MEFREDGGGRLEPSEIEGIGVVPGPVCQERVLFPVQIVAVFPAEGIIAAVGIIGDGADALENDVGRQDRIDVIDGTVFYNSLVIKMKIVLEGMDAAVRAGRAGKEAWLAEEDGKRLLYLLLDRRCVVLDLKSAV